MYYVFYTVDGSRNRMINKVQNGEPEGMATVAIAANTVDHPGVVARQTGARAQSTNSSCHFTSASYCNSLS